MYRYTWQDFVEDFITIRLALKRDGRKFTGIYCASDGGLPLAACLSTYFGIPLHTTPPIERDGNGDLVYDADLMIVDDVADNGRMLGEFNRAGFFIVTLFKNRQGVVSPNIYTKELPSPQHIAFPWQKENDPVKPR